MTDRPHIALKYCGGCNPTYDRGRVGPALQAHFPDWVVAPYAAGTHWDALVVICGCRTGCARPPQEADGMLPVFRIETPQGIAPAIRALETALGGRTGGTISSEPESLSVE